MPTPSARAKGAAAVMTPAGIKGWRERAGLSPDFKLMFATAVEQAMLDEIAELRARLYPAEPKKEIDPRQMDLLELPKFAGKPRACSCKPGCCEKPDARECRDWVKRGMKIN